LWSEGSDKNRFRGSMCSREVVDRRSGEVVVVSYKLRVLLGSRNRRVFLKVINMSGYELEQDLRLMNLIDH
jgi:hypothetical protein